MNQLSFIVGKSYLFCFISEDGVLFVETKYKKDLSPMYGKFDCGIELNIRDGIVLSRLQYSRIFNVGHGTDAKLRDCINHDLYVFNSKKEAQELLPKIIKERLTSMKEKAATLMAEYMKLADDCTTIENVSKSLKKGTFVIETLSQKE